MSYQVLFGMEHLFKLDTAVSVCFDTETCQLQPEVGKLRLLQLGCKTRKIIVVIDFFQTDESDWDRLRRFFSNGERYWLAHNAVFDIAWLQEYGIHPNPRNLGCSMLASRLLSNGKPNKKHGLADVVDRYLGIELDKEQQKSNWAGTLTQEQKTYAAKDVEVLCELDLILNDQLCQYNLNYAYELECRALPAMAQMWRTGLPWNKENLAQRKLDYEHDIKELSKEFIRELDSALPEDQKLPRNEDDSFNLRAKDEGSVRAGTKKLKGFNLNSPQQLKSKLSAVLKVELEGVSKKALSEFAGYHPVVQMYLNWKKAEKRRQMITSIQEKMQPNGFVKASYMQLGAETGRMTCFNPNNQQIPKDKQFRGCVEAPEGWLIVDADFGQMELRLAAAIAKDEKMIQAFKDGEDLHTVTAEAIGCTRQIAKSANFGLLYGSGANGLRNYAAGSGVSMTLEEAQNVRSGWFEQFEGIANWHKDANKKASNPNPRIKGPGCTPFIEIPETGMQRYLFGDANRLTIRCNTPVQGAGAAILKQALGKLWPLVREAGEGTVRIAAAVHDEILLLVREDAAEEWAATLKRVMEEAEAKWLGEIPALAEVSFGKTWQETH
tara:strand:+ start:1628 stop:3448 length:1821 start_codon:yes stop_codon:yes gene_type:complete